jgi:hypothetical protein
VIADLSRWLQRKHISLQSLDRKVVDRFLQHHLRQNGVLSFAKKGSDAKALLHQSLSERDE